MEISRVDKTTEMDYTGGRCEIKMSERLELRVYNKKYEQIIIR